MEKRIRNIEHATVLALVDQVACQPGQIVSKTLAQNSHYSLTLFAFDKGEEIGTHDSNGDALVTILEGTARVTINGTDFTLNTGESIIMPAKIPHSVFAPERFKMQLLVLFPGKE